MKQLSLAPTCRVCAGKREVPLFAGTDLTKPCPWCDERGRALLTCPDCGEALPCCPCLGEFREVASA